MNKIRLTIKLIWAGLLFCYSVTCLLACEKGNSNTSPVIKEKSIYKPKEFANQDWNSPASQYSYKRMSLTEDLVIFWEKGFGNDLSNPPDLGGNSMKVDLPNLEKKLERFFLCYRDTLKFVKTGSLSEKYRMMVMLRYSSEGTAYGGAYDNTIGALWVAPNRLQDEKLNVLAHELGHSFQSQIIADGTGECWGGGGIWEMCAQWMLWHVNPNWMTDENYHWEAFKDLTHKAFLHMDNIYHSPQILEYWSEKHGLIFIADLFRAGRTDEDPVTTYKRLENMTQEQFNDEMFDAVRYMVNLDYKRVYSNTRKWANSFPSLKSHMTYQEGWYQINDDRCPENYGFNAIKLEVPQAGTKINVDFQGLAGVENYSSDQINVKDAGWRYGFVEVTEDGNSIMGNAYKDSKGNISFTTPTDKKLSYLWFVVMGAPTEHFKNPSTGKGDAQWPYKFRISGTDLQ